MTDAVKVIDFIIEAPLSVLGVVKFYVIFKDTYNQFLGWW